MLFLYQVPARRSVGLWNFFLNKWMWLFCTWFFVFREQESSAVPRPPTSPGTLESDYHMVSLFNMHSVQIVFLYTILTQTRYLYPAVLRIRVVYLGSWFLPIPDLGSKNSNKREGWKNICCRTFFCSHKFHKIENYFIFKMLKKKNWANFQRIIEPFTQKIVTKL